MAEPFTYEAWPTRFLCGKENPHVQLINLRGPNNAKATAYSCSMNIDIDGEPQAYGPPNMQPMPREPLKNGGWLPPSENAEKRADYEKAMQRLKDLTTQRDAKDPAPDHAAKVPLEKKIIDVTEKLHKLNPFEKNAVNNGKIFWKWYGVYAMTPEDADREVFDKVRGIPALHPQLDDKKPELCDVYGKYPVIQSIYEPGPGYYVSKIPGNHPWGSNPKFKPWDQRFYLPANVVSSNDPAQPPYTALSGGLQKASGLKTEKKVVVAHRRGIR